MPLPEPLFDFVLRLVDRDSLGLWTGEELRSRFDAQGRPSRLPLGRLISLERRRALPAEREERDGERVERIWRVVFDGPIRAPIPYSVLGYHPGQLLVSATLVMSEWYLGELEMSVTDGGETRRFPVRGLTVLRVDAGHMVMDIDAWLDQLLGRLLDDAWMNGFAVARVGRYLMGVGISQGRTGRRIYGEFAFAEDEARPHGSAQAQAISRYSRKLLHAPAGSEQRAWRGLPD
ncbi:MAG: hypothetical protein R6X25_07350 [Candidatus Krumholzibacteriia bacterium]